MINNELFASLAGSAGKCVSEDTKIKIRNKKTNKEEEITIKEFFERCSRIFDEISFDNSYCEKSNNLEDRIERKFIKSYNIDDYEIETEDGWKDITYIHKTIEYDVYELKLKSRNIIKMYRQPYCVS